MTINFLAEIWGISLVVISMAVIIRPRYLTAFLAEIENEAKMFCLGVVIFVLGLAMVLTYNTWSKDWQVIITILGWISTLKGLCIIFWPEFTRKMAKMLEKASFLPYALMCMLLIGLVITYFGFTAI